MTQPSGPGGPRGATPDAGRALLAAAALGLLVLALYAPAARYGSLGYDDAPHVFQNPEVRRGLTASGVRWAFAAPRLGNWVPLTWISHMLDVEAFGADAGMHHLVNAALHAAGSGALLLAFRALTGSLPAAAAAAALFALHPLRVESVAWISERKDVLMGLFAALALLAYARHVRRPPPRRLGDVAALFALGLMAKPLLAPFPLLLLVLDWWPLGRVRRPGARPALAAAAREKVPLFLLSLAAGALSFAAQAPVMPDAAQLPLLHRAMNAAAAIPWYLGKTLWPSGLAILYPHAMRGQSVPAAAAGLLLVAAVTALVLLARRRAPWLAAGWAWFAVALAPTLGLVQVGMQAHADRYSYLPHVGLALAAGWSAAALAPRAPAARRALVPAALAAAALALALVSRRQLGFWRDETALFGRALAVTTRNAVAHNQLGASLLQRRRYAEAEREFRAALAIAPEASQPLVNLGVTLAAAGRRDEAIALFRGVLAREPANAPALRHLGLQLARGGSLGEGIAALRASLASEPGNLAALQNLGTALLEAGRFDEAAAAYREALAIDPGNGAVAAGLSRALARGRRAPAARAGAE